MATKTIYLEKKTESILEKYAAENNLTLSKAINIIIQGKLLNKAEKPVKNPAKDSEQKKDIKQRFKGFRAPSNW